MLLTIAEVAWLVAARAVHRYTRAPRVEAEVASLGLRDEPPAVVNLITNRWVVTAEVVAAIIADLAYRGVVDIQPAPGSHDRLVVRSMRGKVPGLTSYEVAVVDHLRVIAQHGVVPASLMASTPASADEAWWRHLRHSIVRDARRRRLTRPRYPRQLVVVMAGALVAFALALLGLLLAADLGDPLTGKGATAPWAVATAVVGLGVCLLVARSADVDAQRPTKVGLATAREWLGTRAGIVSSSDWSSLRPGAVTTHGRLVAYATAMGAAPRVATGLPLGATDQSCAWSDVTGQWRPVTVAYPRWRPAWGVRPTRAVAVGAAWTATLLLPLFVYSRYGNGLATELMKLMHDAGAGDEGNTDPFLSDSGVRVAAGAIATVIGAALTLVTINAVYRGVLPLVCGLADLGPSRTLRGKLVRARRQVRPSGDAVDAVPTVALDTGRRDDIVARRIRPKLASTVSEGDLVEVKVTAMLGFVGSIRPLVVAPLERSGV
ncbi:MAG TPA: hypothetical protein VF855_01695 [Acidimicrobiales bacterium]